MRNTDPVVTVALMAYNQEKYIREALESVLNQKTSFEFEIVIGEDCSTDDTRKIIRQYAEQFSNKIVLLLNERNLGMVGNLQRMRPYFKGKYIAPIDGGDYWVDTYKLQKQVDYLEAHPEMMAVAGKMRVIDEKGELVTDHTFSRIYTEKERFTLADTVKYLMPGHVNSLLYRNYPLLKAPTYLKKYDACAANGDSKLTLALTLQGDIGFLPQEMVAFRIIKAGWTSAARQNNINIFEYKAMDALTRFADDAFGVRVDYSHAQMKAWFGAVVWTCRHPSYKAFKDLCKIYYYNNNKAQKLLFLVFHIITLPFRKIFDTWA